MVWIVWVASLSQKEFGKSQVVVANSIPHSILETLVRRSAHPEKRVITYEEDRMRPIGVDLEQCLRPES